MKYFGFVKFLPIVLGTIALLLGVVFSFYRYFLYGGVGVVKERVPIYNFSASNITDSSFTVSFTTVHPSSSFLVLDKTGNPGLPVLDSRDKDRKNLGRYTSHFFKVSGLEPLTAYNFKVVVDSRVTAFSKTLTTGPSLPFPSSLPFFGRVVDRGGNPVGDVLLKVVLKTKSQRVVSTLVTLTEKNGSFVFNVGNARTENLSFYAVSSLSDLESVGIVASYGAESFTKTVSTFNALSRGGVKIDDLTIDFAPSSKKSSSLLPLRGLDSFFYAFASNLLSFEFVSPGRFDVVIYQEPAVAISASSFLKKLSDSCGVSAYWVDRLENGAWESFILKEGQYFGSDYPIEYTKAYFVVVEKANSSCTINI